MVNNVPLQQPQASGTPQRHCADAAAATAGIGDAKRSRPTDLPLPQQSAPGTPRRRTRQDALNLPSRTLSTIHQDVHDKLRSRTGPSSKHHLWNRAEELLHTMTVEPPPLLCADMTTTLLKNRVWCTSLRENSQRSIVVVHQRVTQHPCPRRITNVACLASDTKYTRHCAKSLDSTRKMKLDGNRPGRHQEAQIDVP